MKSATQHAVLRTPSPSWFRHRGLIAVAFGVVLTSACDGHWLSDPGMLANITVTPNATMSSASTQQMLAVGHDADGRVVTISPTWSVVAGGGTIDTAGMFTAGAAAGTFMNTVRATSGALSGSATVIVHAVLPPASAARLKSAAGFAILASAVGCAASGTVRGTTGTANIGSLLPVSGFPPCMLAGIFSASAEVVAAEADLLAAYLAARGQACNKDLTGVDLSFYGNATPTTLPPGTYCFATSAALNGTMVLTGSATDTWTFQIGTTLTAGPDRMVLMAGGAVADNVYWVVGSSATIMTRAQFKGNILARQSITLQNGAALVGRALTQIGAVDMTAGAVTITKP